MSAVQAIRLQAAEWLLRLDEAPADAALREDCARWCAQDARHARALAEMQRLWGAVGAQTPLPEARPRPARRRGAAGSAALAIVALIAAATMPWRVWLADERTAIGELRTLTLADGSRLTLNGDSAVDIAIGPEARVVQLLRGEVYVEVAKASAPFSVRGRDGAVEALGTRYAVRRDEGDSRVTVTESRVRVLPRDAPMEALELVAGSQVRFDARGVAAVEPASPQALSWREGRLVFDDAPLPLVLRELARQQPGVLWADESALASLRFTGVLPAARPEQALAMLQAALPIAVTRPAPWVVRVAQR